MRVYDHGRNEKAHSFASTVRNDPDARSDGTGMTQASDDICAADGGAIRTTSPRSRSATPYGTRTKSRPESAFLAAWRHDDRRRVSSSATGLGHAVGVGRVSDHRANRQSQAVDR